jgi:poly-gamma-glutamate capsule biosynthesis protein CapA/YwtB (metallophosphatase superfamily)
MYFATLAGDGPTRLRMSPMQMKQLQLRRTGSADTTWLRDTFNRISRPFGTRIEETEDGMLMLADIRDSRSH